MKRYGGLWEELVSFENLYDAARKAQRGKRLRPAVLSFHFRLERELWKLHEELADKKYQPGSYRTFYIHEPKKRKVSFNDLYPRLISWIGHACQADTYRLRCRLFDNIVFQRATAE